MQEGFERDVVEGNSEPYSFLAYSTMGSFVISILPLGRLLKLLEPRLSLGQEPPQFI